MVNLVYGDGDCKNKRVEKSLSKNLSKTTDYATPNVKKVFT